MTNYYELLGLTKDATNKDVKKAYFAKIKIHSPEKDPETFVQIRKAYETLIDDSLREKYDANFHSEKPYQDEFLKAVQYLETNNGLTALKILKDLDKKYPNDFNIQFELSKAYLTNGNTGNATKLLQSLLKEDPTNQDVSIALGDVYLDRDFNVKAEKQYLAAVKLNKNNATAWGKYICFLYEDCSDEQAYRAFKDAFEVNKEMFLTLPQLYILYINLNKDISTEDLNECISCYLKGVTTTLKMSKAIYDNVLITTKNTCRRLNTDNLEKALSIINAYNYDNPEREYIINKVQTTISSSNILCDENIHDCIKSLTYLLLLKGDDAEDIVLRFKAEFYIVQNSKTLTKDLLYLKENYPDYYELNSVFYNRVTSSKNEKKLKEQYDKRYDILRSKYPHAFYDDDDDDDDDDDYDDDDDDSELFDEFFKAILNGDIKITPNMPCPCGSGKPYRNCCM